MKLTYVLSAAVLLLAAAASPLAGQTGGMVYLSGNSVADNGGPFLGLGATYMQALRRCKYDRNRFHSDLAFLASNEIKYIRVLSMVGWYEAWAGKEIAPVSFTTRDGRPIAAWPDYWQQFRDMIDIAYDTYGMRTELTIFADAQLMSSKSTRITHMQNVLNNLVGREHKIMHLEVANEAWQNGFPGSQGIADLREFCQYLTDRTAILVGISATPDATDQGIYDLYAGSTADIATEHFVRNIGTVEGGWWPVHDCWRLENIPGVPPGSNNEPIGPGSSVAEERDPIKLVMAAAFNWGANLPLYVFHCESGVFGNTTFESNPGVRDYKYLNDLLPGDFANWPRHDGKESASPFTNYANGQANRWWMEVSNPANGAVRNTGKNNGSQFITLPIGILGGGLQVQARRPVSFTAYNPLTGAAAAGATLNTNGFYTIPQGPGGYIVKGVYTDAVSSVSVNLDTVDIERGISHINCCDGNTVAWPMGGRMARANNAEPDRYMYFNVSDGFAYQGSRPSLTLTIDYFDKDTGTLTLQYDASGSSYKTGPSIQFTNTNTWKQVVWQVTDAYFGNRENAGADFRLAYFGGMDFYIDNVAVAVTAAQQAPFGGTPRAIPGTIQAEDFDEGGQGIAYNDADGGNNGGAYRSTDVDVEGTSDTGGGYNVGWTGNGEWLEYTVNVANTGDHTFKLRLATCCSPASVRLEMNGQNVSGSRVLAPTGGWQNWTTILVPSCFLTAGNNQVLRLFMESGDLNINKIDVTYGGADAVHVDLDTNVLQDGMTHPQVGDGDTQGATIGGHNCRQNVNNAQDFYFYFSVSDVYAYQGNRPNLWISFDYYDTGTGSLTLQYDATSGSYKTGPSVTLTNTNTWKSVAWNVTDAYFGNRQNNGADFRIFGGTNRTFYIDTVQVSLAQP